MAKWADRVLRAAGKWVLVALALGMALRAGAEEPRYFAIRHARIVPVSGPEIKSGTVVIAKGLIVAVGENVSIPPEAWVIEGKGLRVYPGFINALSDLGLGPACPGGTRRRWRRRRQGSTAAGAVKSHAAPRIARRARPGQTPRTNSRWRTSGLKPGAMAASLPPWPRQ